MLNVFTIAVEHLNHCSTYLSYNHNSTCQCV